MLPIDLHTHSNASDGSFSPEALLRLAAEKGIRVLALTDHDTTAGLPEALRAGRREGVTVLPGIELSSKWVQKNRDIHILGYRIHWHDQSFLNSLKEQRETRDRRNARMIALMNRDGIPITMEDLKGDNPETVVTRGNFARYLTSRGYAADKKDAFRRLIGVGCPYYLPREQMTPEEAVRIIRDNGGYPFLAHPGLYHLTDTELNELVHSLADAGLFGIEACHSAHSPVDEAEALSLAERYGLRISGGSDFHGESKPDVFLGEGYGDAFLREPFFAHPEDLVIL